MVSSWDFSQSLYIGTPCFRAHLLQQVPHSCQSGLSAIEGPSLFSLLKAGTPKSSSRQASDAPRGLACLPVRPASPCPSSPELFIPLPQTFACLYFFFFPGHRSPSCHLVTSSDVFSDHPHRSGPSWLPIASLVYFCPRTYSYVDASY